jgi:hypothetical protein
LINSGLLAEFITTTTEFFDPLVPRHVSLSAMWTVPEAANFMHSEEEVKNYDKILYLSVQFSAFSFLVCLLRTITGVIVQKRSMCSATTVNSRKLVDGNIEEYS